LKLGGEKKRDKSLPSVRHTENSQGKGGGKQTTKRRKGTKLIPGPTGGKIKF